SLTEGMLRGPQTFGNSSKPNNVPKPNNNGNRMATSGPTLVCEYYGFNGHTIDSNSKSTLKQARINFDYEANQYLTYTYKDLANVIDILYLKIKVSNPNGTEAFITKVRNLVLTNLLTLYNVLIVPEYCVSLVPVHKESRKSLFVLQFLIKSKKSETSYLSLYC
ncbi:hypothetical protein Tco_1339670, partial [Tanacetum coccineum]